MSEKVQITAIEAALPAGVLTNAELFQRYPHWNIGRLADRTGVDQRHIAEHDETALDLATSASAKLIADRGLNSHEIDALIFSTQTPDYLIPGNASILHNRLDLRPDAIAFDMPIGCAGFPFGVFIARSFIQSRAATRVLLATADTYSRMIHPEDRATRCLFGDGGAVTLIEPFLDGLEILDIALGTDGRHYDKFIVPAGGARRPRSNETAVVNQDRSGNRRSPEHIFMDGLGVLSFFNTKIPQEIARFLARNRIAIPDVDLFVFHQASAVALDSLQKSLKIPDVNMMRALSDVGNLVAASIPLALKRAMTEHRLRAGALVLLCGFGVGLSWGSVLVRVPRR